MEPEPDWYARMRWNTPLSEDHAGVLLDRLAVPARGSVLDLGCGWGELLLRALETRRTVTGVGVDTDAQALRRAAALAAERGLGDRVRFVNAPARSWAEPADRVMSVGAAHAFEGGRRALAALARRLAPGGRLLFGDGCWQQPPTPAAIELFGEDVRPLPQIVRDAGNAGWRVLHTSTADQDEWDEFESSWRMGREEWLRSNAGDPRAAELRAEVDQHAAEYAGVYRGVLGFAYLILTR